MYQKLLERTIAIVGLGALALTSIVATPAQAQSAASAAQCTLDDHCYGVVYWGVADISAVEFELGVYQMQVNNPGNNFATAEAWVGFDAIPYDPNNYWVEMGITRGASVCGTGLVWFTASQLPGHGYVERCHGAATLSNTKHLVRIQEATNGTWDMYRDGVSVTRYTGAPSTTENAQIGIESAANSNVVSMTGGKLRYRTAAASPVWKNGWASPSYPSYDDAGGTPCYSLWVSQPNDMRARCNLPQTAAASTEAAPAATSALQQAQRIAALAGDPSPSAVTVADSTPKAATAQLGTAVDNASTVTIVKLRGKFTGLAFPRPQGTAAPTGDALTVVLDKETGTVLTTQLTTNLPG
ncbi:hypothetical protein [Micromonospora sp. NPDC049102]|uniref:hypothetical protein n=1 Tax=Micromonospora sp. NPDC049102 TaxID=3364265 RepID=UPI003719CAFE